MQFFTSQSNKGYSLVEVMVAISILMLAIIGPMTIAVKGLQSSQFVKNQTIAYMLAQEGIESIISIKNFYIIQGVHEQEGRSLSTVWDWTDDTLSGTNINWCFTDDDGGGADDYGCNLDRASGLDIRGSIVSCENDASEVCVMDYNPDSATGSEISPFYINADGTANDTKFKRVIRMNSINDHEVRVVSEVSWESTTFSGDERSVRLVTHLFKLYETP